jgi:hypothetical protein
MDQSVTDRIARVAHSPFAGDLRRGFRFLALFLLVAAAVWGLLEAAVWLGLEVNNLQVVRDSHGQVFVVEVPQP